MSINNKIEDIEIIGSDLKNLEEISILEMEILEDAILKGYSIKISPNMVEASNNKKIVFIEYSPEGVYVSGVRKNGIMPEPPLKDSYPNVVRKFRSLIDKYRTN